MNEYTVIGFYPNSDNSRFADYFLAIDPDHAEERALNEYPDLAIVGVVEGQVPLVDTAYQVKYGPDA